MWSHPGIDNPEARMPAMRRGRAAWAIIYLTKAHESMQGCAGQAGATPSPEGTVDAWRELAIETIRNLSSLVEEAQSTLRRAQQRLDELNSSLDD